MAKSSRKKKRGGSQATPAAPAQKSAAAARAAAEHSRVVGLTLAGTVLSLAIAFPPVSPLLLTAPVVKPLIRRVRGAGVTSLIWRWALTVFLTVLVSAAFVFDRMLSAFPFAAPAAEAMERALAGTGGAPAGLMEIVLGVIAFAVLAAASMGIAACVLLSIALGTAAAAAAVLFVHGNNVLMIALVACPPWQWSIFVAAILLFTPAVDAGRAKLLGIPGAIDKRQRLERRAIVGAGLILISVLLRLILSGPYLDLIRRWTVR